MADIHVTDDEIVKIVERYNDLQVQSMMYDMDIDIETWSLEPKRQDETPIWIKKWREKEHNGDRQPNDYQDWQ